MTDKERMVQLVEGLPDTATFEDLMEKLYVLSVIERGEADIQAGRLVSHEDAKKRLAKWLEK